MIVMLWYVVYVPIVEYEYILVYSSYFTIVSKHLAYAYWHTPNLSNQYYLVIEIHVGTPKCCYGERNQTSVESLVISYLAHYKAGDPIGVQA